MRKKLVLLLAVGLAFFGVLLAVFLLQTAANADWPALFKDRAHKGTIFSLTFSGDGQLLASTDDHNELKLVNLLTGNVLALSKAQYPFSRLSFSPNSDFLLAGNEKPILTVYNLKTAHLRTLAVANSVDCLSFVRDGSNTVILGEGLAKLDIGGNKGRVAIWQLDKKGTRTILQTKTSPTALTLAGPDNKLAVGFFDGTIAIMNLATMKEEQRFHTGPKPVFWLGFLGSGKALASLAVLDERIAVWDIKKGTIIRSINNSKPLNCCCVSSDGRLLATADLDSTVRIWDLSMNKIVCETFPRSSFLTDAPAFLKIRSKVPAYSLSFSPDGRKLAAGLFEGTLVVWDLERVKGFPQKEDWRK